MSANPPVEKNPKTGARTGKNIILQTRISDKYNMLKVEVKTTNKDLHHTQPNVGVFNPSHTRVSFTIVPSGADNDTTPIKKIATHRCALQYMTKNKKKIFINDQQGHDERFKTCYATVKGQRILKKNRLSNLVERDEEYSMTKKQLLRIDMCVGRTHRKKYSFFPTFLEHCAATQRKGTHSIESLFFIILEGRVIAYMKIIKIREIETKKSSRFEKNSSMGARGENFVKSKSQLFQYAPKNSTGLNKIREIKRITKRSPYDKKTINISWNPTRNSREIKNTKKFWDEGLYVFMLHNISPSLGIYLYLCSTGCANFHLKVKTHSLGCANLRTTWAGGWQMFATPTTTWTYKPIRTKKMVPSLAKNQNNKQTVSFWFQSAKYHHFFKIINMEADSSTMESPPAQENATRAAVEEAARSAGHQGCEKCRQFAYCVCDVFIFNDQDQGNQCMESGPSTPKPSTSEPLKVNQAAQPSGKECKPKAEGKTPPRKCRKRPGETQRMAEERVERLEAELAEEKEEKEQLKAQLEEAARLLLKEQTDRIADNGRQSELLQEQMGLLETSKHYHDMDLCLWEDERETLTGRIGDMTEELKNKDEEIGDLNWRIMGYEHTQSGLNLGAFCPISLGLWAEGLLNKN